VVEVFEEDEQPCIVMIIPALAISTSTGIGIFQFNTKIQSLMVEVNLLGVVA
jgi:hypothetical protein